MVKLRHLMASLLLCYSLISTCWPCTSLPPETFDPLKATHLLEFKDDSGNLIGVADNVGNFWFKEQATISPLNAYIFQSYPQEWSIYNAYGKVMLMPFSADGVIIKGSVDQRSSRIFTTDIYVLNSDSYVLNGNSAPVVSIDPGGNLHLAKYFGPAAPKNVSTTNPTIGNVPINWTDNSNPQFQSGDAITFVIERADTNVSTAFREIGEQSSSPFYDRTASVSKTYYYRVRCKRTVAGSNDVIYSLPSDVISVVPQTIEPEINITAVDSPSNEGSGNAITQKEFTFTPTFPVNEEITVNVSIAGTAVEGFDYTWTGLKPGKILTITAQQPYAVLTANIIGDDIGEDNETIQVSINSITSGNAKVGSQSSKTYTIQDDDYNQHTFLNISPIPRQDVSMPDGWDPHRDDKDTIFTWDRAVRRSDYGSLKIQGSATGSSYWHQIAKLDTGINYYLECWLKTAGASGQTGVKVVWLNSLRAPLAGKEDVHGEMLAGDNDWKLVALALEPPTGAEYADVQLFSNQNSGSAWFDDFRLVKNMLPNPSFDVAPGSTSQDNIIAYWGHNTYSTNSKYPIKPALFQSNSVNYQGIKSASITQIEGEANTAYWTPVDANGECVFKVNNIVQNQVTLEAWARLKTKTNRQTYSATAKIKLVWYDDLDAVIQTDEKIVGESAEGVASHLEDMGNTPQTIGSCQTWNFWQKFTTSARPPEINGKKADSVRVQLSYERDTANDANKEKTDDYVYFDTVRLTEGSYTTDHFEVTTANEKAIQNVPIVVTVRCLNADGDLCMVWYDKKIRITTEYANGNNLRAASAKILAPFVSGSGNVFEYTVKGTDNSEISFDIVPLVTITDGPQPGEEFRVKVEEVGGALPVAVSRGIRVVAPAENIHHINASNPDLVNGISPYLVDVDNNNVRLTLNGAAVQENDMGCLYNLTQKDFEHLKAMGVNLVRLVPKWSDFVNFAYIQMFTPDTMPTTTTISPINSNAINDINLNDVNSDGILDVFQYKPKGFAWLDNVINMAEHEGIYVILDLYQGNSVYQVKADGTDYKRNANNYNRPFWDNRKTPLYNNGPSYRGGNTPFVQKLLNIYRANYVNAWKIIANRYAFRGNVILGYSLQAEPNMEFLPLRDLKEAVSATDPTSPKINSWTTGDQIKAWRTGELWEWQEVNNQPVFVKTNVTDMGGKTALEDNSRNIINAAYQIYTNNNINETDGDNINIPLFIVESGHNSSCPDSYPGLHYDYLAADPTVIDLASVTDQIDSRMNPPYVNQPNSNPPSRHLMYSSHWYIGSFMEGDESGTWIGATPYPYNQSPNGATFKGERYLPIAEATEAAKHAPLWIGEITAPPTYNNNINYRTNAEHPWNLGYFYEALRLFNSHFYKANNPYEWGTGWSWTFFNHQQNRYEVPGKGDPDISVFYNSEGDGLKYIGSGLATVKTDGAKLAITDDEINIGRYAFDNRDRLQMIYEYLPQNRIFKAVTELFSPGLITNKGEASVSHGYHAFPYTYTDLNNNVYEVITETGANPPELEHTWEFKFNPPSQTIGLADVFSFYIKAHRTMNKPSESYVLEWATDPAGTWHQMNQVIDAGPDAGQNMSSDPKVATYNEKYMVYNFANPHGPQKPLDDGTLHIRVRGNSMTGGIADSLYVDHMYLRAHKFTSSSNEIKVLMPTGGKDWAVPDDATEWGQGTPQQVNWVATNDISYFSIYLVTAEGGSVVDQLETNVTADTNGNNLISVEASTLPTTGNGEDDKLYNVRVENSSNSKVCDESPGPIRIKKIHVLTRGGMEWGMGTQQRLSWSSILGGNLTEYNIKFMDVDGIVCATITPSVGDKKVITPYPATYYTAIFTVPATLTEGLYSIQVQKIGCNNYDNTDRFVYVKEITVVSPESDQWTWTVDGTAHHHIQWRAGLSGAHTYNIWLMDMHRPNINMYQIKDYSTSSDYSYTTPSNYSGGSLLDFDFTIPNTSMKVPVGQKITSPINSGPIGIDPDGHERRPHVLRIERVDNPEIADESDGIINIVKP